MTDAAFEQQLAPFRGELLAYCYRMLGSAHDAEDLVQDTYLRAWRAREAYDASRASLRTWLYRIASNACLTALEGRERRPLPSGFVGAVDADAPFSPGFEVPWLQPLPDALVESADPAAVAVERGGLRLAFAAALQHLSAGQRAALVLRDVLGFSAAESADLLGTSVAAVNSALQRARGRLRELDVSPDRTAEPSGAEQQAWLDRYMAAFQRADVDGLTRLLAEDVLMEMPPMLNWFSGISNYATFMRWVFEANGTDWRLVPVSANGQPGFAAYSRVGDEYRLHTLQVFEIGHGGIRRNSVFQVSEVFAAFRLAPTLAAD